VIATLGYHTLESRMRMSSAGVIGVLVYSYLPVVHIVPQHFSVFGIMV
jgi:hypothetical protein